MKFAGYVLFLASAVSDAAIWLSIWQLVDESRQANPDKNFSRFWWLPAWQVHKNCYPASDVKRKIVLRFIATFALLGAATACFGYSMFHT
ncbi:hypothetical protein [Tunturiibacter gelidiferens]|uniref:hypothetical protein n=1 Tax=Tunturiibacter gelidiferens TaxID=3069689 RepID=UPI003D9BD3C5